MSYTTSCSAAGVAPEERKTQRVRVTTPLVHSLTPVTVPLAVWCRSCLGNSLRRQCGAPSASSDRLDRDRLSHPAPSAEIHQCEHVAFTGLKCRRDSNSLVCSPTCLLLLVPCTDELLASCFSVSIFLCYVKYA